MSSCDVALSAPSVVVVLEVAPELCSVFWHALILFFPVDTYRLDAKYTLSTTRTAHGRDWIDGYLGTKAEEVLAELARVRVSTYCRNVSASGRGGGRTNWLDNGAAVRRANAEMSERLEGGVSTACSMAD